MTIRTDRAPAPAVVPSVLQAAPALKAKPVAAKVDRFESGGAPLKANRDEAPSGSRAIVAAPLPQTSVDHLTHVLVAATNGSTANTADALAQLAMPELLALVASCDQTQRPALAKALEAAWRREAVKAHSPLPPSGCGARLIEIALAATSSDAVFRATLASASADPWTSRIAALDAAPPDIAAQLRPLLVSWLLSAKSDAASEALIDTMLTVAIREQRPVELADGLRALDVLSPMQRERLLSALPSDAREDQRELYGVTFMREAPAITAQGDLGRGAEQRLLAAAQEITTLDAAATFAAAYSGNVGFAQAQTVALHPKGRREPELKVPLRFHPNVPASERAAIIALVQRTLEHFPAAALERMLAGHDDEPPLQIAIAPGYAELVLGHFTSPTSVLTLNADLMSSPLEFEITAAHELTHALMDDLRSGAVTNLEVSHSRALAESASGTPLYERYYGRLTREYNAALVSNFDALEKMPPKERDAALLKITREVGAVTFYALHSGSLDEYVSESFAYYLVPTNRAILERADPLLAKVLARVLELLDKGDTTTARELLLLGVDPVQAVAITKMVLDTGTGPLNDAERARVDACRETLNLNASGLDPAILQAENDKFEAALAKRTAAPGHG